MVSTSQALDSGKQKREDGDRKPSQRKSKRTKREKKERKRETIHAPEFDFSVVGTRNNQRHGPMEGSPIDTSGVTLKDVFDLEARNR
jgi:hypothetical protein